jgi:hypothetical protein
MGDLVRLRILKALIVQWNIWLQCGVQIFESA